MDHTIAEGKWVSAQFIVIGKISRPMGFLTAQVIVVFNKSCDRKDDKCVPRRHVPSHVRHHHAIHQRMVRTAFSRFVDLGPRLNFCDTHWLMAPVIEPYRQHFGNENLWEALSAAEVYLPAKTPADLEKAARDLNLRPLAGGRLTLKASPTVAVLRLRRKVGDIFVAPWPRVFVDLQSSGVRGEEAAEHLREVLLGDRGK